MFKPVNDYVLLQTIDNDSQTNSGIIIPDISKEAPIKGKVISVSDGSYDGNIIEMTVKTNNIVIFNKYAGTKIKIEDQEYLIVHMKDILGIIK